MSDQHTPLAEPQPFELDHLVGFAERLRPGDSLTVTRGDEGEPEYKVSLKRARPVE
jgi:hypothetical protein